MSENQIVQESWWQKITEKLQVSTMLDTLKQHKDRIIEIALYAGAGFLLGFFIKRCGGLVINFILFIVALVLLHQFGFINLEISWIKISQVLGIELVSIEQGQLFTIVWAWIRLNWGIAISALVGFLIGIRYA